MDLQVVISCVAVMVSIGAFLVGISALIISIWQGMETRKNYHLSVTPHVEVWGNWIDGESHIGISLINNGIGPAIIRSIEMNYLDNRYDFIENHSAFVKAIMSDLEPKGIHVVKSIELDTKNFLSVGQQMELLTLQECDEGKGEIFYETLTAIHILVCYESMYGHCYLVKYH